MLLTNSLCNGFLRMCMHECTSICNSTMHVLELSNRKIITIVEIVIFMITNAIMIMDLLNQLSITILGCFYIISGRFCWSNLHILHTNSYKITIQMIRQPTITIVNRPRLSQ